MKMKTDSFGIAMCTVEHVVAEICTLMSEDISPSFIVFPSQKNDALKATSRFYRNVDFLK